MTQNKMEWGQVRQKLLSLVSHKNYTPLKVNELLNEAGVGEGNHKLGKDVISELVREGVLISIKRKGLVKAGEADLLTGTITFTKKGAGIVTITNSANTFYIPKGETGTAMPGDKVVIRLSRKRNRSGESYTEACVVRVEERRCRTVVGTYHERGRLSFVTPMQSSIPMDIVVTDANGANVGERVLVKLDEWDDPSLPPQGAVTELLGAADDPQLDTIAVIKSYNLPEAFSEEVIQEAEKSGFSDDDYVGREDLRESFIFTIDPASARDFDDAVSLIPKPDDCWELGVHIADVAHFVTEGSALDREAYERGTSVYLPDKVIPMLPPQLSNGLCSLNPNKDRLAFSIFMTINSRGQVIGSRFANSVIHSKLRMSYHQAFQALKSPPGASFPEWEMDADVVSLLKDAWTIAEKVRKHRYDNGALHIDLPQSFINIGKDGKIASIDPVMQDPAHQLIEEYMILANEAISRAVAEQEMPQIYRIHEEPDPEKLAELEMVFIEAGISPGNLSAPKMLSRLLIKISDMPQAHLWCMKALRSLKRAVYSTSREGHFGLAKEFYCHFTSPIRRYPDLIMHRIMKGLLVNNRNVITRERMDQICFQSSDRENRAISAEREIIDQKKIRFFQEQLEADNAREFDAFVTEVNNFGMTVELPEAQ
ncbi:hypothetical protein BVX99_03220, partial [bacterium F16]